MSSHRSGNRNTVMQYVEYLSAIGAQSNIPQSKSNVDTNTLLARTDDARQWTPGALTRIFRGLEEFKAATESQDHLQVSNYTAHKAIGYLLLIVKVLAFRGLAELNSNLGRLFLQYRDAIVHWLNVLLSSASYPSSRSMPLRPVTIFTLTLKTVQYISDTLIPREGYAAWLSSALVELFITRLWRWNLAREDLSELTRICSHPSLFGADSTYYPCGPTLSMVANMLTRMAEDDSGSICTTLIHTLEANPYLVPILMEGVQKKALYLVDTMEEDDVSKDSLLKDVVCVAEIIGGLRSLSRTSEVLQESLHWDKEIPSIVDSIECILEYLINECLYLDNVALVTPGIVHHLMVEVLEDHADMVFSLRARLAMCLLNLLQQTGRGLLEATDVFSAISKWDEVYLRWRGFKLHTSIAKPLSTTCPISLDEPDTDSPLCARIDRIMDAILCAQSIVKEIGFGVCDNALCQFVGTLRQSKVCKCRQVAYCSEECQKVDWNALHRGECAAARVDYNVRNASGITYDVKERATHLMYLERSFSNEDSSGQDRQTQVPAVFIVDMSGLKLETVGTEWDQEGVVFTQEYLKSRFKSHFQGDTVLTEDRRMAVLIIPFTTRTLLYLTAVLQRLPVEKGALVGDAPYRVVYSIARFGSVASGIEPPNPLSVGDE